MSFQHNSSKRWLRADSEESILSREEHWGETPPITGQRHRNSAQPRSHYQLRWLSPCLKFSHHLNSSNAELFQPGCKRREFIQKPEPFGVLVTLWEGMKFLEAALWLALSRRKKLITESGACQSRSNIFQVFFACEEIQAIGIVAFQKQI